MKEENEGENLYSYPPAKSQKGGKVRFCLILSDQLRHLYNPYSKKLDNQLLASNIKSIGLFQKQLDNPLPWFKKLQEMGLMGSVDFYDTHRVQLRLGNRETIFESKNQKRHESTPIMKKDGVRPARLDFSEGDKSLCLGQLIRIIYEVTPKGGYDHLSYNCNDFSRNIYLKAKKVKKGKDTILESKESPNVGFQLMDG